MLKEPLISAPEVSPDATLLRKYTFNKYDVIVFVVVSLSHTRSHPLSSLSLFGQGNVLQRNVLSKVRFKR